ncbi:SAV_6107 family HEPN domain-containing protein [Saccharothrix obliqua]|uniref:SAV_6107 family HEPN domain-containing protein n=1 Tax=Saccharothrix obliqua TaxID=2861747 RepID=UPI001C5CCCDA|nr:SAV_6107 family HEPN domain-containing protein [Saccharothrix obliqua]MBW4721631.1 hypothetical protein [Saccharothrix obliqua]
MSTSTDFPSTHRFPPPSSAAALLGQARACVRAADRAVTPADRFTTAYLAALRAAGAVLALRGRPVRGRAEPTSAWALLPGLAPELREWAWYFASCSPARAALRMGAVRRVDPRSADDLVRQAGQFTELVDGIVREGGS